VPESLVSPLSPWDSFYVIIGSSGAALTGLQFVVMALGAEGRTIRGPEVGAFGTPNVVHFSFVLLLSAILTAPWAALTSPALVLGVAAAAGLAYTLIVIRRARRQTGYHPVLEDWIWHCFLPFLAYTTLLAAAIALPGRAGPALFVIAAAAMLLLMIGIHNAWDTVTYIAIQQSQKRES